MAPTMEQSLREIDRESSRRDFYGMPLPQLLRLKDVHTESVLSTRASAVVPYISLQNISVSQTIVEQPREVVEIRSETKEVSGDWMLGAAMHDMRTPLQIIALGTEFLSSMGGLSPNATLMVGRMHRAADRIRGLINELLASSQAAASAVTPCPCRIAVDTLLSDAVMMMCPIADRSDICLEVSAGTDLGSVNINYEHMLRVFSNLIGNAIKFSLAGSRINITADRVQASIRFGVRDQGSGIAAADLSRVFERGWQAQPNDHRGAGLGLTIVSEIVASHGGTIGVSSVLGKGSEFHFTIPSLQPEISANQAL